jgi:hypothetical protein
LGVKGQYGIGNFDFFGEAAGGGLIGSAQSGMNFVTAGPILLATTGITSNYQSLTSPNTTQVVPSFDAKMGAAYTFPPSAYGLFKVEAGYQVAVYFNAVNSYALSMVTGSTIGTGVYLETDYQRQTNFTVQGPYLKGNWLF